MDIAHCTTASRSEDGIAVMDSSEADYLPDSVDNVSPHGNEAPGSGYVAHNGGYDEGQSSNSQSSGGTEIGEADGDEEDGHMQNVMNEEDIDGLEENLDSDDGDDDDGREVPIPTAWNQDFSDVMTVNDGHESAWAYHQGKV